VRAVAFAADSEIAIAAVGQLVQAHAFTSGRYERLQTLKGNATAVAVSTSGSYLAVGEDRGSDEFGRIWLHQIGESPAPSNLRNTREIEFPYTTGVFLVAFSPDSQQLAAANEYGSLAVYEVAAALPMRILQMPEPQRRGYYGRCAAFSPDSAWLASAGDRRVVMWNTRTWDERLFEPIHQAPITHLVFSADGRWLITAAADGLVRWDLATGNSSSQPLALNSAAEVRSLVFLGGDQWLLSGAADKRFLLWNWHEAFSLAAAREEVRRNELRRQEELRR
jgi:WD40 repeat protein